METTTSLGTQIDNRGLRLPHVEEGDVILDIVLVTEIMTKDGRKGLFVVSDEETNWLKEYGMLQMAVQQVQDGHR